MYVSMYVCMSENLKCGEKMAVFVFSSVYKNIFNYVFMNAYMHMNGWIYVIMCV